MDFSCDDAVFIKFFCGVQGPPVSPSLKIAVDSATLALCDLRDYFASPLLVGKKKRLILMMTLKTESCCSKHCYRIVRIVHVQTYPKQSSRLRPLRHQRFHNNNGSWRNRKFHNDYKGSPSDRAIRGLNSLCIVVVVSCCATD